MTTPSDPAAFDVGRLRALLERGGDVTVLDVRPTVEREEWSIPGSLHQDAYQALRAGDPDALAYGALPRDKPVVAVCAMGRTSTIATRLLRECGYDAYSLAGGVKAWSLVWNTAELAEPRAFPIQVRRPGKG